MRGEHSLLRLGEYLVRRASRHLPPEIRDERYGEWAAELPAILHDPDIKLAARRAVRMLRYAADTIRGAVTNAGAGRRRLNAFSWAIVSNLVAFTFGVWTAIRVSFDWVNYVLAAWPLVLMAVFIGIHRHRLRERSRRAR